MEKSMPAVSIVIINYNTFQLTCQCIHSIYQYTKQIDFEIILVDNASDKDNADDFLIQFPKIKLIKNPVNNGFAGGNNLGIQEAQYDTILLLNSDTYLLDNAIAASVLHYASLENAGAMTIKLLYENRKYQKSARRFRSIGRELLDFFRPILYLLPYQTRAKLMLNQYFRGDFNTQCDWCNGAFFMFSKKVLAQLPQHKLDDRYFMYGEDELWSFQMKSFGYMNYYYADAAIIHIANASTSAEKRKQLNRLILSRTIENYRLRHPNAISVFIFSRLIYGKDWLTRCILALRP